LCAAPILSAPPAGWAASGARLACRRSFIKEGPFALYAAGFGADEVLGKLTARGPAPDQFAAFGPTSRAAAQVGSYLVLGEAPALQAYLADVAGGRVWSGSAGQVAFLSELLPRAG
jgi:hypothetical protein